MEGIIKDLFQFNRCLLGEGFDNSLKYLAHLIELETISIPSGTKLETWTVPEEWVVNTAWLKFNNERILDYNNQPLSLIVGSTAFSGTIDLATLKQHLTIGPKELPDATPYNYRFYDKDWGFSMSFNQVEALQEGDYEVYIDTEYRPGNLKLGVHTIKGGSDREILLFAHLDHPYQANDNLSGVAALVDLSKKLKTKHTIKIIFCPETIGSIAYAKTQDITKVDFVIALDACGNDAPILIQKAFDKESRLNRVMHCALQTLSQSYRKGEFRTAIGSDEYYFNDPKVNIPGLMLSTWPYPEYHTSADTPEIIHYETLERIQNLVKKIIEIYEKDFIPVRNFVGPLFRSKYGIQSPNKQLNLNYDYLFYSVDGKRSLAELCCEFELNFDYFYDKFQEMIKNGDIGINTSEKPVKSTTRKKSKGV